MSFLLSDSLLIHMVMLVTEFAPLSLSPLAHLPYLKLFCEFGAVNDYAYRPARRPHIKILWHD